MTSTVLVTTPPFLAPYVAWKAAFDALAVTTSYEVNPFGIETTIVMPGAFTGGTEHFPNASRASDDEVTKAYSALDPLVARNEEATSGLFPRASTRIPRSSLRRSPASSPCLVGRSRSAASSTSATQASGSWRSPTASCTRPARAS